MCKKIATLLLLTSFCSLFAASSCQQHNMKIEGTCEHLQDGDTLFLTDSTNSTGCSLPSPAISSSR